MVRVLARSLVGVALLGLGAAGGAALAARPDPPLVPKAVSAPTAPVEIRTVIKRRTVHVYRKPKHRRSASVIAPPTPSVASAAPTAIPAPALTRVTHPVAPAAPRRPLETRRAAVAARAATTRVSMPRTGLQGSGALESAHVRWRWKRGK
jgi:hypothetical protein